MSRREQAIEAVRAVRFDSGDGVYRPLSQPTAKQIVDAILALPDSRDAVVEAARELRGTAYEYVDRITGDSLADHPAMIALLAALDGER